MSGGYPHLQAEMTRIESVAYWIFAGFGFLFFGGALVVGVRLLIALIP